MIDDDRQFRLTLVSALELRATVRTVDTVDAAYRLLDTWRPHAVVLDPAMRAGDGLELLATCMARKNLRVFCCLPGRFATSLQPTLRTVALLDRNSPARSLAQAITTTLSQSHSGGVLTAPTAPFETRPIEPPSEGRNHASAQPSRASLFSSEAAR
ncbi:hypothetical protein [Thermomicrobium sp. 4228-Ro]|uniref:hypothetical protein n=1 Tax=Thermomicrobium sp. 4228-Ro TaxID=2993937 RepID=UPI003A4C5477